MENNDNKKLNSLKHWQMVSMYLVIYDIFAVTAAYFLALLVRFDFAFTRIPIVYLQPWAYFAPLYAVICVLVFWRLRLYRSIWRFASFTELERITLASIITTIIHIIGVTIVLHQVIKNTEYTFTRMPYSYLIMGAIFQFVLITGIRFSYRFILLLRASRSKKSASRVMLIGMHSIIGTTWETIEISSCSKVVRKLLNRNCAQRLKYSLAWKVKMVFSNSVLTHQINWVQIE